MTPAVHAILWLIAMAIVTHIVFILVGMRTMVQYFPEGWRWWMPIAQHVALGLYAAVVTWHPF